MSIAETPRDRQHLLPTVRSGLPLSAPLDWLRLGAEDLRAGGDASLFYGACFAVGATVLFLAFRHAVEMVVAIVTGSMLIGPFLAMGLYDISRRREAGKPLNLGSTLVAWKRNIRCFSVYSAILIVLYLIWARVSLVIFALFYQGGMPTLGSFMWQLLQFDNLEFMLAYLVAGALFASLVFAFSVVSIPMMLDRGQDSITAMLTSFVALTRNLPLMLVWAGLIVLLTMLGFATAFLGLIVTMPLVGHATWHAYRALIEPAAA